MIRKVEYISESLIRINDLMFPLYIIKGDRNYLIDCGISAKANFFYNSIKNTINNEKIDVVLLTHSHYDHTGACSFLQGKYNFEIYASKRAVELLKKPKVIEYINNLNKEFNKIENVDEDIFKCSELDNLIPLNDGQIIKIDKEHSLTAFETRGHTKCSMSYFLLPERILFLGDASGVLEKNRNIKPLFLSSYKDYIKSINKLIKLDAEILAMPHNRFIKGKEKVKTHLINSIKAAERLKENILAKIHFKNTDDIAQNLLPKLFPEPTIVGPKEAFEVNLKAMVETVKREFLLK